MAKVMENRSVNMHADKTVEMAHADAVALNRLLKATSRENNIRSNKEDIFFSHLPTQSGPMLSIEECMRRFKTRHGGGFYFHDATGQHAIMVNLADEGLREFLYRVVKNVEDISPNGLKRFLKNFEEYFGIALTDTDIERLKATLAVMKTINEEIKYDLPATISIRLGNGEDEGIPISKFIRNGVGVCLEMSMLVHVGLATLGIESNIVYGCNPDRKSGLGHVWIESTNIIEGIGIIVEQTNSTLAKLSEYDNKFIRNERHALVLPVSLAMVMPEGLEIGKDEVAEVDVERALGAGRRLASLSEARSIYEEGLYWISAESKQIGKGIYRGVPAVAGRYKDNKDGTFTKISGENRFDNDGTYQLCVSAAAADMISRGEGPLQLIVRSFGFNYSRIDIEALKNYGDVARVVSMPQEKLGLRGAAKDAARLKT